MENIAGQYITDGTVTWIVEDVTQGDSVGDITLHPTLLPGHVLADGATVTASEYPRLLEWVQENGMLADDDAHYIYEMGSDTLRLPNAQGRVLQGDSSVAVKAAGLPNITGELGVVGDHIESKWNSNMRGSGSFARVLQNANIQCYATNIKNTNDSSNSLDFKASRSSAIYGASTTVQPPAITMLAQIKY